MVNVLVRNIILPPGAFRLLLAALVLVSHMSRLEVGRLAVMLFFVLSGYWVTLVFERDYDRQALPFFASRILRLAPVYFTCLFGAVLARGLPLDPVNFMLLGVATSMNDPTGVAWSLDIELQFYLMLPFLLLVAERLGSGMVLLIGIALTGAAWWLAETMAVQTVGKYLPAFIVGIALARTRWRPSRRAALASGAGFVIGTAMVCLTAFGRAQLDKLAPDMIDLDVFAMVWAAILIPYVAYSLGERSGGTDKVLGDLSYPLYLCHVAVLALVVPAVPGLGGKLIAVAMTATLTLGIYVSIDRPAERWRKHAFARWRETWRSENARARPRREAA